MSKQALESEKLRSDMKDLLRPLCRFFKLLGNSGLSCPPALSHGCGAAREQHKAQRAGLGNPGWH